LKRPGEARPFARKKTYPADGTLLQECVDKRGGMGVASAARELRYSGYNSRSAVYGDLAYDLDREVREHTLRHAGEARRQPREESAARPQVRRVSQVQVRQKQKLSVFSLLGFGAVAALAVLVLMSYIQLTELSSQVVELKSQLSTLQTENVTLTAQYERMYDLETVKAAAEAAGMGKPSSSQIYYIDLSDGDNAVVYQKEEPDVLSRLLTSLNHGIYTVVEYFD
jgi:cell division protein FtsL